MASLSRCLTPILTRPFFLIPTSVLSGPWATGLLISFFSFHLIPFSPVVAFLSLLPIAPVHMPGSSCGVPRLSGHPASALSPPQRSPRLSAQPVSAVTPPQRSPRLSGHPVSAVARLSGRLVSVVTPPQRSPRLSGARLSGQPAAGYPDILPLHRSYAVSLDIPLLRSSLRDHDHRDELLFPGYYAGQADHRALNLDVRVLALQMERLDDQLFCPRSLTEELCGFCQDIGQHEEHHIGPMLLPGLL